MTDTHIPLGAERLRERLLIASEQLAVTQREVADLNMVMRALRGIVHDGDRVEPFEAVFALLRELFRFEHAVVLVDSKAAFPELAPHGAPPAAPALPAIPAIPATPATPAMLHCIASTIPEIVGENWTATARFGKVLRGRVLATVPHSGLVDEWPSAVTDCRLDSGQPALYLPLKARDQTGLLMMIRTDPTAGFDQHDITVAYTVAVLASQALSTWQGNTAQRERRHLRHLTGQLRKARDALAHRADHDSLTGLANRELFEGAVTGAIERAEPGRQFAVVFIDIDGFKQVNDYYGHTVGDLLLVAVADRLRAYAVDSTDLVARISGDEFMLLSDPITGVAGVLAAIEVGLGAMRAPIALAGHELIVSVSVGVAVYPANGTTYDELRRHADIAMYHAKSSARGGVVVYESQMGEAADRQLDREQDLRRALAEGRFRAVVQPKVDLATLVVVGFEILARQVDEAGRMGSSAGFIDVATHTGLLDEITELVLGDALAAIPKLDAAFGPDTVFSVNVSTRQATDPQRLRPIVDQLRASGYGDRFLLEVTEDALLVEGVFTEAIVPLLADAGLRVSIDDFGTGYASLSRLLTVTADEIKIDRSFVTSIGQRPRSQVMVKAMESIAVELGAMVVAEGVETADELDYFRANTHAQLGQGYLFARPMAPADLAAAAPEIVARVARMGSAGRKGRGARGRQATRP